MRLRIAPYGAAFLLLALVIFQNPGITKSSYVQQEQLELIPPPQQPPKSPVDIQIGVPHPTPGANLRPFFRTLVASVTRNVVSTLPESAVNGRQGSVVVRVQIQKDGSLSKDGVAIESTSGTKDMDSAAQSAVRSAAPFGPLPEAYKEPDLILLLRISYLNVPHVLPRKT